MTKKRVIFIFIVIIIISILLCLYYLKSIYYTLDDVSAMLNSAKLPQNVYIKECEYTDEYTYSTDIYIKDNIMNMYNIRESSSENIVDINSLIIYENQKVLDIDNINKIITVSNVEKNYDIYNPDKYSFFNSVQQHGLYEHLGIYKYCGKENIDGKKCIKVSFTDNDENSIHVDYYYIDIESNLIIQVKSYSGSNIKELQLIKTKTWEYKFDVVTDSDIIKFDINNYPDYEYNEF